MDTSFDQANVLQRAMRWMAGLKAVGAVYSVVLHRLDGPVLRWTKGRASLSALLTGMPIIELTTTGAKTGAPRTLPLIAVADGDALVLIASNFGKPEHPAWSANLRAYPRCRVVHRGVTHVLVARETKGEERERLWALGAAVYPSYNRYAQRTTRRIRVFRLEPAQ